MKSNLRDRLAVLSTAGRVALLGAAMLAAFAGALPIAFGFFGSSGVLAAGLAAATILSASVAGMLLGDLVGGPGDALTAMLAGMVLRMALPLAACLVIQLAAPMLAAAGFVFFVLAFYLLALPVDTMLALAAIGPAQRS